MPKDVEPADERDNSGVSQKVHGAPENGRGAPGCNQDGPRSSKGAIGSSRQGRGNPLPPPDRSSPPKRPRHLGASAASSENAVASASTPKRAVAPGLSTVTNEAGPRPSGSRNDHHPSDSESSESTDSMPDLRRLMRGLDETISRANIARLRQILAAHSQNRDHQQEVMRIYDARIAALTTPRPPPRHGGPGPSSAFVQRAFRNRELIARFSLAPGFPTRTTTTGFPVAGHLVLGQPDAAAAAAAVDIPGSLADNQRRKCTTMTKIHVLNWYIQQIDHLLLLSDDRRLFKKRMRQFRSDIDVGAMIHDDLEDGLPDPRG